MTLVMGNWKMNLSLDAARSLAREFETDPPGIPGGEVVLIPSPVHVATVGAMIEVIPSEGPYSETMTSCSLASSRRWWRRAFDQCCV
jgi:hypothetical protein